MRFQMVAAAVALALAPAFVPAFARTVGPETGIPTPEQVRAVADRAEAVVTIKFVMKFEGPYGEAENEMEISGVLIDAKGLVVCSNTQMGGFATLMARMGGERGGRDVPREIKVLVGDDQEGLDARVIARESDLDLAWVQIGDTKGRELPFISLDDRAPDPRTGDAVLLLGRMGKFFDRAPVVYPSRVFGVTRKPRHLLMASVSDYGLPVFNAEGKLAGLSVLQLPSAEEMEAEGGFSRRSGGGPMILPAADVASATARAREAAASGKSPDEAPPADPARQDP